MDHAALSAEGCVARRSLGLLLSPRVDAQWGERIDAIAAAAGARVQRLVTPLGADALQAIDAAFFSRELYEGSTVRNPAPLARSFFAAIDAAPRLRWLHVFSSGTDLAPYQPALKRGVHLTTASGATALPIAQSAVVAMLALSRGFAHWLSAQQRREWHPLPAGARPRDLAGQRAVIIGAGPIGREIARLLGGFGIQTTAVRRRAVPVEPFDAVVGIDRLDEQLPGCDWLVLACPLTDQTRSLIDARRIALLPPVARIANVSRGEVLDETAFAAAVHGGCLAGGYLDVFQHEPLPADSPLWTLPGVWITPHNCAASQGHETRVVETFLDRLGPWLREQTGETP